MKREGKFRIISVIPNFITSLRIVGTASLLFIDPLTELFYLIYTLSGLSDLVDGFVARATHTTSELGSRLDSIADLLFYAVMIIRVFPELWARLAVWIWYVLAAALAIRVASYSYVAVRHHRLSAMHTYGNKATGLLAFLVPYFLLLTNATPPCGVVVIAAVLSSAEELTIHLVSKEYDPSRKSIFLLRKHAA
jgi:CDP-diacylglycerol--glycerol-3-phosphate 3-phosphatidyltransferase